MNQALISMCSIENLSGVRTIYWYFLLFFLYLFSGNCSNNRTDPAPTLTVSAAASLTIAFKELAPLFEEHSGIKVIYNFGSSGKLTHQIEQGAPVDLFASANSVYIDSLAAKNLIAAGTFTHFGRGHLVLWSRSDSPLKLDNLNDLLQPEIKRFAIANPDHAPYGIAARQALQRANLWARLQPKLVMGQNVRQALHYAETGNVDAALVARSLSQPGTGRWVAVPVKLYSPPHQSMAVMKSSEHPREAGRFASFVESPQARSIMQKYGFLPPGVTPSP